MKHRLRYVGGAAVITVATASLGTGGHVVNYCLDLIDLNIWREEDTEDFSEAEPPCGISV